MANFLQPPVVNFACTCGILNPITKLYFCRHCLKLRCGFCVCHEVDSYFCSYCHENIPSSEARHKRNRCGSCFDCPSCQHTLSLRQTTVAVQKKPDEPATEQPAEEEDDGKEKTKKMYHVSCFACRWTSRDAGIPDQTIVSGSWPEMEYANETRFNSLLDYYQAVVIQEKQEKQDYWRRKTTKQHKFPSITDRTGLTVSIIRRQMGWSDKTPPKMKPSAINPSIATDEIEELPADIFTEELDLRNITTIKQRHNQPSDQPEHVSKLFPQHKLLWIKRSLRCRQCEHNVIKPEYHPGSIKYRIQLFASYHVPDVRLVSCESLKPGQTCFAILKLANPTMHDMTITIMDLPTELEESLLIEEMKKGYERQVSISSTPSFGSSLSRQASLTEEPRFVKNKATANIILPDSSFALNHRDDVAEFDECVQVHREEPNFVVWRKSNKVSIKLGFTPDADLAPGDDVVVGFTMQYTYVNTFCNSPDKKEPQKHALTSRVYVKVGQIPGN
uniref:Dynactin subunit 4 n=1 Tax=Tabanus bromius TaxID=304241 RepID=A0A0K8TMS8_TABBR